MRLRADRRDERRSEATERNAAWQALSTKDKLHVLARRPGNSKRQVRKLGKELPDAVS